jgi:SAM-dependent methyltransferase
MVDADYGAIIRATEERLRQHGDCHQGVGWPKAEDAETRYRVMLAVIRPQTPNPSILDFGCGAAHLYDYMQRNEIANFDYTGLDISPDFIDLCQSKHPGVTFQCADVLVSPDLLPVTDYVIMNGIFTEKRELSFESMLEYMQTTLKLIFSKVRIGIAFNVMSKQVDWERDDLFHLPMDVLANFLCRDVTRQFIFRNDYGLYEYTTYVYKS